MTWDPETYPRALRAPHGGRMGARDRLRFAGMANVHAHWDDALLSVAKGDLDPTKAITHRMSLDDAAQGYELFKAREAMKVVLTP